MTLKVIRVMTTMVIPVFSHRGADRSCPSHATTESLPTSHAQPNAMTGSRAPTKMLVSPMMLKAPDTASRDKAAISRQNLTVLDGLVATGIATAYAMVAGWVSAGKLTVSIGSAPG